MVRRIFFGNDGGTFKFRASRPGVNAQTAELNAFNYQIYETMTPMAAVETGTVSVPAGGTSITLTGDYEEPPLILTNVQDNYLMGASISTRFFPLTGVLQFFNYTSVTKSVRYAVLADFF